MPGANTIDCKAHDWGVCTDPVSGKKFIGCLACGLDKGDYLRGGLTDLAVSFKAGHCPSCTHPQHVGNPCFCGCPPDKAIKADTGKQRNFHLFAWDALPEIVQIYEYGIAKGYLPDSWRNVPPEQYGDALVRHVIDLLRATTVVDGKLRVDFGHKDPESGKRTLAHLAWNTITLLALTK